MILSKDSEVTLERLRLKANLDAPMPSLRKIKALLDELQIESNYFEIPVKTEYREYTRFRLIIPKFEMILDTTSTLYSDRCWEYAYELHKKLQNK